jgi:hypothetical protein
MNTGMTVEDGVVFATLRIRFARSDRCAIPLHPSQRIMQTRRPSLHNGEPGRLPRVILKGMMDRRTYSV